MSKKAAHLLLEMRVVSALRKGASLLQYDVPPSRRQLLGSWNIDIGAHRAAGVEYLHGPGV